MKILNFALIYLCLFPLICFGEVSELVKDVNKLVDPKPETVVRVRTARIVLADYKLIRHDFPETKGMTDEQIDQWLLKHAGYMSKAQVTQARVNTRIETAQDQDGNYDETIAYRPQLYGRALVFKAGGGLIDAKGVGVLEKPVLTDHKTGLGNVGEMIREFMYQKKVQQIFDYTESGYQTVACYAVIDWGFDAYDFRGVPHPAGAVLRQAHVRPRLVEVYSGNHFANEVESKKIEDLLRHFGLTSAGDTSGNQIERANVQISANRELVDFGAFLVKGKFLTQYNHYTSDTVLSIPSSRNFVQPDTRMSLSVEVWGSSITGVVRPRSDNPWVESEQVAVALRNGTADRTDVLKLVDRFMSAGSLPADLKGSFKGLRNQTSVKTLEEIFNLGFSLEKFIPLRLFTAYLIEAQGKYSKKVLDQIFHRSNLQKAYANDMYEELKRSGVFIHRPDFKRKLAVNAMFTSATMLYDFLDDHQESEIELALRLGKFERIELFLTDPKVMKNNFWSKWVLAVSEKNPYVGSQLLAKETESARFPELLKQLAKTSPIPMDYLEALRKPHWSGHPELVDDVIEAASQLVAKGSLSPIWLKKLTEEEPWKSHPRRPTWDKLIHKALNVNNSSAVAEISSCKNVLQ